MAMEFGARIGLHKRNKMVVFIFQNGCDVLMPSSKKIKKYSFWKKKRHFKNLIVENVVKIIVFSFDFLVD